MRAIYRRAAVLAASGALIFFCSCERHKPDELAHGEHAQADSSEHGKVPAEGKHHEDAGHAAAHPSASPAGTPAQFFPSPTPR